MDKFETAKGLFFEGSRLLEEEKYEAAEKKLRISLEIIPDRVSILINLSAALIKQSKLQEAKAFIEKAVSIDNKAEDAWLNYGLIFMEESRYSEAIKFFNKALAINPDYIDALFNKGSALLEDSDYSEAIEFFNKALTINPEYPEALYNKGCALNKLKRKEEMLACYEKALSINPEYGTLPGIVLNARMQFCNWENVDAKLDDLSARVRKNEKVIPPFISLGLMRQPSLQRKAAEIFVQDEFLEKDAPNVDFNKYQNSKIRIGYYSADYHNHATTYLMAKLFEMHDSEKFELFAFSFGPDKNDEMRHRMVKAFDHFMDVRLKSDKEIVQMSRDLKIDIAVDLKGYTEDCRPGIFYERVAPLQVSYLGYPGTMGADFIDYLVADTTLIPEKCQKHYSEKIVYLPDSYQVNDDTRKISNKKYTRDELGLPDSGFVYCCFNNNYKITPATFDGFMRILKKVPGSVLWLYQENSIAPNKLRQEAIKRGISGDRLVFAKRLPLDEHLARHRLADLFIDTLPYNAHTTASDALWAGLPVLTCMGEAFASRVAGSLLNALDLPELITESQQEFEALAVELATNPTRLEKIKHKLEKNRQLMPLFNTPLFTKHLEAAYTAIYERYKSNFPIEHTYIEKLS